LQLLLIEDDRNSGGWLADRLAGSGIVTRSAGSSEQALRDGSAARSEAVIVDAGMAGSEGDRHVRPLRNGGIDQPLMVLSARGSWRDRVASLDAGADDYLIKPVRAEEVAARLRAIIRRSAGRAHDRLQAGGIELDLKARMASHDGIPIDLTRNEYLLLRLFLLRPGAVLAYGEIRDHLYKEPGERSLNAIEVHVARLRGKIGRTRIRTVRGVGYSFVAGAAQSAGFPAPVNSAGAFAAWCPEI
jgi:two-component system OmpR family response regulator